ncbi:hypothetical protein CROQUDRAFT_93620 [Cronartium quercuum f. sp. fusiforme G11]|uniref:Uncharacterized protein n=1 Tax=Cronartium quercuum f. sp. fusiforme G11 TaxID=708437 RepID=A0A9P6NGN8_9BASI|nr:hypothetical protein CROQUDRAFT_93620 [Cronartium quercuum f. sp. fusiforme G11]
MSWSRAHTTYLGNRAERKTSARGIHGWTLPRTACTKYSSELVFLVPEECIGVKIVISLLHVSHLISIRITCATPLFVGMNGNHRNLSRKGKYGQLDSDWFLSPKRSRKPFPPTSTGLRPTNRASFSPLVSLRSDGPVSGIGQLVGRAEVEHYKRSVL